MIRRHAIAIVAGLVLALSAGASAGSPPARDPVLVPPVENLSPRLRAAKQELVDIVARRDMEALLTHVRPETKLSFGGAGGADDFRRMWDRDEETRQQLWRELDAILALPGKARDSTVPPDYCVPYVFCSETPGDIDPFEALVVIGSRVAIRERPSLDGKVLARVSHLVLSRADDTGAHDNTPDWIRVQRASGLKGYISTAWVRSPIDFRLSLALDPGGGTWWLQYFIAGD